MMPERWPSSSADITNVVSIFEADELLVGIQQLP